MKTLFRSALTLLLILCLSTSVFAWIFDENPLFAHPIEISTNTPVEITPTATNTLCLMFRLNQAGSARFEVSQPLPEDARMRVYIGNSYYQYCLYSADLPDSGSFLSPQIGLAANQDDYYYPDNYYIVFSGIADAPKFTVTVNFTESDAWEVEPDGSWYGDITHEFDKAYYGTINSVEDYDFYRFDLENRSHVFVTLTSLDGMPIEEYWSAYIFTQDIMYEVENPVVIRHSETKVTYDLGMIWECRLYVELDAVYDAETDSYNHDTGVYSVEVHAAATDSFPDVADDAYYAKAVEWAIRQQITDGTSRYTFSPEALCTRAQIVTFLYRLEGAYDYLGSEEEIFTDVISGEYYYFPIYWAYDNQIANGTSATTFSPNAHCTRAQAVTFLWRYAGCPTAENREICFDDVQDDAYYAEAVAWAVENGITLGTSENTFSPDAACTRGQIVTFLHRYINTLRK